VSPRPRYTPWSDYGSGPIAVEGGIKARSARGAIGEQWWSKRFIAVLESYGIGGRLQRGRAYARRGQVLEFTLTAGLVTARVQGSRPQPYRVSIGLRPLTPAQWTAVESRLAAQALFRARLLAGEMPAEIEEVFVDAGTPLFPQTADDLDLDCNCPDWGVPCKHLAAVCYVLAEAFDIDPFAMLAWRGKGRDDLLAALRGQQASGPAAAGSRSDPGLPAGSPAHAVLADVTGPALADSAAAFWSPGLSQARLRSLPQNPPAPPDVLLRLFAPPAIEIRGQSLGDLLRPVYARLADETGQPEAGQSETGQPGA
jgi:uncharacterized Zn finger protein